MTSLLAFPEVAQILISTKSELITFHSFLPLHKPDILSIVQRLHGYVFNQKPTVTLSITPSFYSLLITSEAVPFPLFLTRQLQCVTDSLISFQPSSVVHRLLTCTYGTYTPNMVPPNM